MVATTHNPYVVAAAATIGGMLFGFDVSSVSAFVNNATYREYFDYPSSTVQGIITSAMAAGSLAGSLVSGGLSDGLGRKRAVQVGALIWIAGSIAQAVVQSVLQLVLGRFVSGVAIGICSSQVPVYIAELAPKAIRGRLVGTFQWAITWGIMIMFFIAYGCTFMAGTKSFRIAWALQLVPGLLLYASIFFFPESPRWLATQDRWEEAESVVAHIQGGGDAEHADVLVEMQEMREVVRVARLSKEVTVRDLFAAGASRRRTLVGMSAQMYQQLTGINVMMYYVVYTFAMAGYTDNADLVASSVQYVVNVLATIPALLFIDNWGRRKLLLTGSMLMALWLFLVSAVMGGAGHYVDGLDGNSEITWYVPSKNAAKAVIVLNYLFVATFAPTWGPGTWVYVSEIFPLKQRATANGLCAAVNWTFNFLLALLVPLGFKYLQWRVYLIFAVCCAVMTVHVFLVFPETKGRTLEEIDLVWESPVSPWRQLPRIALPTEYENEDYDEGEDEDDNAGMLHQHRPRAHRPETELLEVLHETVSASSTEASYDADAESYHSEAEAREPLAGGTVVEWGR
ncbi:general substrate transporter [Limtongia smithiae]|uniref:general substrate transporter n=1 Tax=Limtongia smithiae TaxID=1125753 RepID=UPI0034CD6036